MPLLNRSVNAEQRRLNAHRARRANWKHWGPYLSERAWGTVREDYSEQGNAWAYFPHDHARSRAYRWNEDALAGFCDRNQYLCFGIALWNGQDPCLKERLFGLGGPEGNHGEDVKELYWYFFDVSVSYANAAQDDILISVVITNRADKSAPLTFIPQLWFRNTWSWGYENGPMGDVQGMPEISQQPHDHLGNSLLASHPALGDYHLYWQGSPTLMLTNNETNSQLLHGVKNKSPYVKDAFHQYVVNNNKAAINPDLTGTKAGLLYHCSIPAGACRTFQFRLSASEKARPFVGFKPTVDKRRKELHTFYESVQSAEASEDMLLVQRQALAGMLWSKQLYYYDMKQWQDGDPDMTLHRKHDRNAHWQHMHNFDIMSMPDKWEYPWYAVWDTAFHTLPLAMVDSDYARQQLTLITRERYMHPNGQLPAYEWAYDDVNPPVHAWAAWSVYKMAQENGRDERAFLEGVFQKMLLNFTWWAMHANDIS